MINQHQLQVCRTPNFAGYSCGFSPYYQTKLAVATAANFGLVGNGRLHIVHAEPGVRCEVERIFDTQDGLYDLAWSEVHENQLVTSSGDGSIKLWDITLNEFPVQSWTEHQREVFCLDWNNLKKDIFVSSSWDHLVKIWTPTRPQSILTIPAHEACVYAARFSPAAPDNLASCSSDGTLKIWDIRSPTSSQSALAINAHANEVLGLDWNKYATHLVATCSVDQTGKIHDIRMASQSLDRTSCVGNLIGHEYAIRKIAWSPHSSREIATSGYDMTARVWHAPDLNTGPPALIKNGRLKKVHNIHTEFVIGLAWSLYHPGLIATASWDQQIHIWAA
ncbi:peroxisomal targeting signal 2 receptor [Melampsora americana]|nr:peroxisomal targeting signal 2 receptor [Melampsora americana]